MSSGSSNTSYSDSNTGGGWTHRGYSDGSDEWIHDSHRTESTDGWSQYTTYDGNHKWENDNGQVVDNDGNTSDNSSSGK